MSHLQPWKPKILTLHYLETKLVSPSSVELNLCNLGPAGVSEDLQTFALSSYHVGFREWTTSPVLAAGTIMCCCAISLAMFYKTDLVTHICNSRTARRRWEAETEVTWKIMGQQEYGEEQKRGWGATLTAVFCPPPSDRSTCAPTLPQWKTAMEGRWQVSDAKHAQWGRPLDSTQYKQLGMKEGEGKNGKSTCWLIT